VNRSPVDLVLLNEGALLATANQTSNTVCLVRTSDGKVLDESPVGEHPFAIALHPDGRRLFVSAAYGGEVNVLAVNGESLKPVSTITAPGEPSGLAFSADGSKLYVALSAFDEVLEIEIESQRELRRIAVGRWPRHLAVTADGKRMAVTASGDRGMAIVDLEQGELDWIDRFVGINLGHVVLSKDNQYAYFPWMVYRANPITSGNIRLGWVLASRIARIRVDERSRREAISLDPPGEAIADPHGLALTSDEQRLVSTASGSQELLVYRLPDLPFLARGGPDHIDREVLADKDRFFRIALGGRPMGVRIAPDDATVYVANYLKNSVQQISLATREITGEFPLGSAPPSIVRRGEAIFFDGKRSLDQWYSCHSCHYEGGGNSVAMDTLNDGSRGTAKTVLPLYHVGETSPWTWHGWQTDLHDAARKSLTTTMLGPKPSDADVGALIAYLNTLKPPPNPYTAALAADAVQAGRDLFFSDRTGCSSCHAGPHFTDGEVHDVGIEARGDPYKGFNTPTLKGVYRKSGLLHDGRARSLDEVLSGDHAPEKVRGEKLTDEERGQLIEFLKTL